MAGAGVWSCSLLLLGALVCGAVAQQQYCKISPRHTLCQFSGPGRACHNLQRNEVSAEDKELIVAEHNRLRAQVARGEESRGFGAPQPPAANMLELVWDEELARVAQRHAEQCQFNHDCNECRKVERFSVGQNLYMGSSSELDQTPDWKAAINAWYDEVSNFSPNSITPFRMVGKGQVGHYTQVAWATSSRVGCGYAHFQRGTWWNKIYACNYGEAGNMMQGEMYKRGEACSDCPSETSCSNEFPGLCAEN